MCLIDIMVRILSQNNNLDAVEWGMPGPRVYFLLYTHKFEIRKSSTRWIDGLSGVFLLEEFFQLCRLVILERAGVRTFRK
jgi:hypothetical protein